MHRPDCRLRRDDLSRTRRGRGPAQRPVAQSLPGREVRGLRLVRLGGPHESRHLEAHWSSLPVPRRRLRGSRARRAVRHQRPGERARTELEPVQRAAQTLSHRDLHAPVLRAEAAHAPDGGRALSPHPQPRRHQHRPADGRRRLRDPGGRRRCRHGGRPRGGKHRIDPPRRCRHRRAQRRLRPAPVPGRAACRLRAVRGRIRQTGRLDGGRGRARHARLYRETPSGREKAGRFFRLRLQRRPSQERHGPAGL